MTPEELIETRSKTHGNFADNARITQRLKSIIRDEIDKRESKLQGGLTLIHTEALEMICAKMSRILSAPDPSYADNWDDIAGYAKLGKSKSLQVTAGKTAE